MTRAFTHVCLTIYLIDIHCRITHHHSTLTIAATIDVADTGKRLDIDLRISKELSFGILSAGSRDGSTVAIVQPYRINGSRCGTCVLITIDRVRSIVTTAIQFTDDDRTTANLLDIHCDGATDGSAQVVAAEHTVEGTIGDIQRHITLNVGSLSATVGCIQSRNTSHVQFCLGIHRCTLSTAVCLIYTEVTTAVFIQHRDGCYAHITLRIRTAKDAVNRTAEDVHGSLTGAIDVFVCKFVLLSLFLGIVCFLYLRVVIETHIGAWVWDIITLSVLANSILAVTTTEYLLYLKRAVNRHTRCRCRCSITTAIDLLNTGETTTIYDNIGVGAGFRCLVSRQSINRLVFRQVTTTIDSQHIITTRFDSSLQKINLCFIRRRISYDCCWIHSIGCSQFAPIGFFICSWFCKCESAIDILLHLILRSKHMHFRITHWSTINIVTTKYLMDSTASYILFNPVIVLVIILSIAIIISVDKFKNRGISILIFASIHTIQVHLGIAIDISGLTCFTQSATVGFTCNRSTQKVDKCSITCRRLAFSPTASIIIFGRIPVVCLSMSQGATAIDIFQYQAANHIDSHTALDCTSLATTKDRACNKLYCLIFIITSCSRCIIDVHL